MEGSDLLEVLAEKNLLEDFMAAVDSDNLSEVAAILDEAGIDEETIQLVIKKIENGED
ncbi:MAG: hypothetical protein V4598_07610 [Bdellovibrionota bacterium]